MSAALARIALVRTPTPKRLEAMPRRDDEPAPKSFSKEMDRAQQSTDDDQPATQKDDDDKHPPTAEQMALAGALPLVAMAQQAKTQDIPQPELGIAIDPTAITLAPVIEITPDKASDKPEEKLTPLEQAVMDLVDQLQPMPAELAAKVEPMRDLAPTTPRTEAPALAEPRQLPENTNPSHVHLVVDDGEQRVVVTVAVRGTDVNVALRTSDDSTAAALARNAGTLDEAMRTRGLDLAELNTGRDPDAHEREQPQQREKQARDRFRLEELV